MDAAPVDVSAERTRGPRRPGRGAAGVAAAAIVVLLTASCAAGQHAQTALEKPTPQDFAYADVGSLHLRAVAVQAPDRVTGGGRSYPSGAAVPLTLAIVNSGNSADTLRNITSPAFSGWGVYQTAQIVAAASGAATSSSAPAAASSSPSVASSSSSALAAPSSSATPSATTPSSSTVTTPTLTTSPASSSTSAALGSPAATSISIPAGESVRLGIVNQTGSDTRTGSDVSAQTVVMTGLHGSNYAPLFPARIVPITFDFAHNGSATLSVPVQLTAPAPGITVPTLETVANGG